MGREEEIAYAREHGIPVKGGTETPPYSIDDNLWGRSSEGRWIEDLDHAPEDDVFQLVTRPEDAPDEPETITRRVRGRRSRSASTASGSAWSSCSNGSAEIGCRHGVGIVDHIEDRIVGLKVRDIYEVPAAAILLTAHAELEKLVGTIHQNQLKPELDRRWAYLVYAGLWWEPLRSDLDAFMDAANAQVSGSIGLKLYKGSARVVTRSSPNAVYDAQLASFAESGGLFSQAASPGFIELWSLQSRMAHRIRQRRGGGELMSNRIGRLAVSYAIIYLAPALPAADQDRRRRRRRRGRNRRLLGESRSPRGLRPAARSVAAYGRPVRVCSQSPLPSPVACGESLQLPCSSLVLLAGASARAADIGALQSKCRSRSDRGRRTRVARSARPRNSSPPRSSAPMRPPRARKS